ncbi:lytic polysaccharide monooxygenase auxiliary activity family 9 protein [Planosporangium mesophilum]|nr:lytic polysaccharide monooxygenase [Planosporangium mesophilum]NJC85688.1 chitin-binding protein [Planosporangium mesophilum]
MYAAAAVLAAGVGALVVPTGAAAHGAMMKPGSRTYLCWQDGLTPQGNIVPNNPACAAAVNQSGAGSLYNWFAVLRSNGAGRMAGFIPDGQLCSGGTGGPYDFTGFNLARNDWPVTHLTSGASMEIDYSNWAKHPGTFSLYITKDSWSPTRPLAWSDLESAPFDQVTNPPDVGGPGTNDGHYYWTARLPSGKSGRHLIYSVWARSDSQETFYGCSDVTFDGGNGQVTGVGPGGGGGGPGPSPSPTPTPTGTPTTPPPSGGSGCTASYTVGSSWNGGFSANVTVRNSGASAINGWTVKWTFPGTQTVSQLWNGSYSQSGSQVTVKNASYNGSVGGNATTTFGFNGSGASSTSVNNLTCTSP